MIMDGVTVKVGEVFDLKDGAKAKAPSQSGEARHDCNCRCFLKYDVMTPEEFAKATGQSVEKVREKYLTKADESGIIETVEKKTEVRDVHYIGKIDRNIYKCVTEDIKTDEVIITDERIQHIKERHPNDYERYCKYMEEIIQKPEYIIEANKPNSALILKSFSDEKEQFKTIMKLVTSSDDSNFKNSIITFMKIDDKEWRRLIKNKKILYKSE